MSKFALHVLALGPLLVSCAQRPPAAALGEPSWTATVIDLHAGGTARVDGVPVTTDASIRAAAAAARGQKPDLRGLVIAHPSVPVERRRAVAALVQEAGVAEVEVVEVAFVDMPAVRSRRTPAHAAAVPMGSSWRCAMPFEAYAARVDAAVAVLRVVVGVDGRPRAVALVGDAGHGYGRAAAACAMQRRYRPGKDATGGPEVATTPPIRVRFVR